MDRTGLRPGGAAMRNVGLIIRREMASYFFSPIAYVLLAGWTFMMGIFFSGSFLNYAAISLQIMRNPRAAAQLNLTPTSGVLEPVFSSVSIILLFVVPLLTMRLFSEEKKEGTIELLLTYPIRDGQVLAAKFLSALFMYLIMMAITLLYPLILAMFVEIEWGVVGSGYLGMILMGSAFLSLGVLASTLTSNQIIAAMLTFMILLVSFVLDFLAVSAGEIAGAVIRHLSIGNHLRNFIRGIIDTRDIVYLLNVTVLCLFLSLRSLEFYKWRG